MNVADTKMCVCVCYITLYTSVLVQFILAVAGAFNMYNTIVMSVTDNSVLSVHCTTYYTRLHIPGFTTVSPVTTWRIWLLLT